MARKGNKYRTDKIIKIVALSVGGCVFLFWIFSFCGLFISQKKPQNTPQAATTVERMPERAESSTKPANKPSTTKPDTTQSTTKESTTKESTTAPTTTAKQAEVGTTEKEGAVQSTTAPASEETGTQASAEKAKENPFINRTLKISDKGIFAESRHDIKRGNGTADSTATPPDRGESSDNRTSTGAITKPDSNAGTEAETEAAAEAQTRPAEENTTTVKPSSADVSYSCYLPIADKIKGSYNAGWLVQDINGDDIKELLIRNGKTISVWTVSAKNEAVLCGSIQGRAAALWYGRLYIVNSATDIREIILSSSLAVGEIRLTEDDAAAFRGKTVTFNAYDEELIRFALGMTK